MLSGYVDLSHPPKNHDTGPSGQKDCWRFIVWALGLTSSAYPDTGWNPRAQNMDKTLNGWKCNPLPGQCGIRKTPLDQSKTHQETADREEAHPANGREVKHETSRRRV